MHSSIVSYCLAVTYRRSDDFYIVQCNKNHSKTGWLSLSPCASHDDCTGETAWVKCCIFCSTDTTRIFWIIFKLSDTFFSCFAQATEAWSLFVIFFFGGKWSLKIFVNVNRKLKASSVCTNEIYITLTRAPMWNEVQNCIVDIISVSEWNVIEL